MDVRQSAVAGTFYPRSAASLARLVDEQLAEAGPPGDPFKAAVVPHAGLVYSGTTAALAYARLATMTERVRRVVLLGPSHRVPLDGLALPGVDTWATPLGEVALVDPAGVAGLLELPQVCVDDAPHAPEHSLEVQLPFLQRVLDLSPGGAVELLPLVVGRADHHQVAEVVDLLWGGPETVLLFSSDLSHFHPYDQARALDTGTVRRMLALDGPIDPRLACGAHGVNGLLESGRHRGLQAELLRLCSSGDTAGDRDRVVGYASIAYRETA